MEYKMISTQEEFQNYYPEFSSLYELCFRQPMDAEEIAWRYFQNPMSELFVCLVLEQGHLVANYSVSPVTLFYEGVPVKAAQSLNTMTHPDYSGMGLFVKSASEVYRCLQEREYELVWGFPNHLSNSTFVRRLNWHDVMVIPTLEVNTATCFDCEGSVEVIEDDRIFMDHTPCLLNQEKIQVYKSNEYLRWRFAEHPHNRYRVFCCASEGKVTSRIISKEYRNILNIVDYSFANDEERSALLHHTIDFARQCGKTNITLWSQLEDEMHLLLERCGARNIAPITYFGCSVFNNTHGRNKFYDSRNWMLHMSDDNVY